MNEREFKAKLRRLLKPHCYIQSMSSYATNGTPDLWLSGQKADLWLEVKYDERTKGPITPKLSPLQRKWLNDRHEEGRNVAVIVGTSPTSCAYFTNKEWHAPMSTTMDLNVVIQFILRSIG